ncbi:MAG: hypothetical protein HYZ92_04460 [Candidatus Omnitrophica bacterium]|nr:hypothetical protein [Candidatus Omnitrophota bacterium]
MLNPNVSGWVLLGFLLLFFGVWFVYAGLLVFRPITWVYWFISQPCKTFGISVSIHVERRFRKRARYLGFFYLLVGVISLGIVLWAVRFRYG